MTDDINDISHTSTLAKFEEAVRKDERSRSSSEALIQAALRRAEGLTAQLAKPDWVPRRAHVEQARNSIEKLARMLADITAGHAQGQQVPDGYVLVPRELTAENGAKAFLSGEFSETFDYMDDEGDECVADIPVSWTTIKAIHKKMVSLFAPSDTSTTHERE
jgi:hypothetical protein